MRLGALFCFLVFVFQIGCGSGGGADTVYTDPRDGQVYPIVTIGTQVWMQKNMNYQTGNSWWYEDDPSNGQTYGRLYDWETAGAACPPGWHLPSDAEWQQLVDYLGGDETAGGEMKEAGMSHWSPPNEDATNSSGFTALPGGYRGYNGDFDYISDLGHWWTSTEYNTNNAWLRDLSCCDGSVDEDVDPKGNAFSVRCLKDQS